MHAFVFPSLGFWWVYGIRLLSLASRAARRLPQCALTATP
jgi:hypothetical protein